MFDNVQLLKSFQDSNRQPLNCKAFPTASKLSRKKIILSGFRRRHKLQFICSVTSYQNSWKNSSRSNHMNSIFSKRSLTFSQQNNLAKNDHKKGCYKKTWVRRSWVRILATSRGIFHKVSVKYNLLTLSCVFM